MPVKTYKPTSPGRRGMSVSTFDEITKTKPERSLTEPLRKTAGRNNNGRITTRHRGAGIALLQYQDGERRYILAPVSVRVGTRLSSGPEADLAPGNALALRDIPVGSIIHNIELKPGRGGQMVRGAGVGAQLMAKEGTWAQVRLPSGEVRLVHTECMATLGQVGNPEHATISIGKAGRTRHMGFRPTVRGSAMNPRDHPHGGGEGKAPIGGQPQTKWGKVAMGKKTRHRKATDKFIVRKRTK